MRLKPAALLALLAIAPFTVGFTPPPGEDGTTISVSGGTGRFLAPSGCSRPHKVEYTDQQAGAYHTKTFHKWTETRLGVGVDAHAFQSREKECTAEDCTNPDSDWKRNDPLFAVSAYGTADWHWVGLSVGGVVPLHEKRGGSLDYDIVSAWIPMEYFPQGSVRVGPSDLVYATVEMGTGRPFKSGGGFPFGLGGRLFATDLWMGAKEWDITTGVSASAARSFGPVRLRFAGSLSRGVDSDYLDDDDPSTRYRVDVPEHSLSVGIDYHLPW